MIVETIEFVLGLKKIIDVEFDEDPREKLRVFNQKITHKSKGGRHKDDVSDDEEDDKDREYSSNQMFKY